MICGCNFFIHRYWYGPLSLVFQLVLCFLYGVVPSGRGGCRFLSVLPAGIAAWLHGQPAPWWPARSRSPPVNTSIKLKCVPTSPQQAHSHRAQLILRIDITLLVTPIHCSTYNCQHFNKRAVKVLISSPKFWTRVQELNFLTCAEFSVAIITAALPVSLTLTSATRWFHLFPLSVSQAPQSVSLALRSASANLFLSP